MYFHLLVCLVFFVAQVCLFFHSLRMKLILTILFYYHWLWSAICFLPDFSGQNAANITSFQDFGNDCLKCRVIWLVRYLRCASFQHKVSVFKEAKLDTTEEKEKQHSICGCDCYCCTVLAVENSAPTVFKMQWAESSFGSSHTWLRQRQLNCDQGGLALKWKKRRRFDSMNSSNNYFQNPDCLTVLLCYNWY